MRFRPQQALARAVTLAMRAKRDSSPSSPARLLTLNAGSSSLRFSLYRVGSNGVDRDCSGKIDRIGERGARWSLRTANGDTEERAIAAADHAAAAAQLARWIETTGAAAAFTGIGHRVVHGGPKFTAPQRVQTAVLKELRRLQPYDPEHLPAEIKLIEWCCDRWPRVPQVACFDTAFHRDLPRVARLLPLPYRFQRDGVRRYGFHGLSYTYLVEKLADLDGARAARGRVILAHLGSGVSLTAVRAGRSIDTTMAFTPTAGVPMGTRSGDLDPGVVWYLAKNHGVTPRAFHEMVNHQSGLRGISGISSDIRDLLAQEKRQARAADAVAVFCHAIRKTIGALAATLGGLDTLVFAGGIGENSPEIRARVCAGLEFIGLQIAVKTNRANAPLISGAKSQVRVRVIPTDEEFILARETCRLLRLK